MAKIKWRGGALVAPVPPVMVSCGSMEKSNIITVAWTGITNTVPPKTYISVRPSRYSYNLIKESGETVPAIKTDAKDTTGAGDTFNGILAACIALGDDLCSACFMANAGASIKVSRKYILNSIPTKEEIIAFMEKENG